MCSVHALTQNSSSVLPNTPFKLKLEKTICILKMYIFRATKKAKALRHLKVEAVQKIDDQV